MGREKKNLMRKVITLQLFHFILLSQVTFIDLPGSQEYGLLRKITLHYLLFTVC